MEDDGLLGFYSMTSASVNPSQLFQGSSAKFDDSYGLLPWLYSVFLILWLAGAFSWVLNTWHHRHFQMSNLQWTMSSVPLLKVLQLALTITFWYSCIHHEMCSLWISFGVYVTGILFQTAYFVSLLLISHGYCIMCECLSVAERRKTAAVGFTLYLTLVGHKASVPYVTAFVLMNYVVSFCMIFHHISKNLLVLRQQLIFIEDEGVQTMLEAFRTKYTMFKYKFRGVVQIIAVIEVLVYMNVSDASENYWFRTLVREWAQLCIFIYIGWNFRTQEAAPRFSVMPALKSNWEITVPPIYSIEMNADEFQDLTSQEWHVAVPTFSPGISGKPTGALVAIVQNPLPYVGLFKKNQKFSSFLIYRENCKTSCYQNHGDEIQNEKDLLEPLLPAPAQSR